jgi:ribonuclease P protein component
MQSRPRLSFTAADRLHRRAEFIRVQRTGMRTQTEHFVVYAARFPEVPRIRLGTTISKRLGKAVVRNRTKRRIRECFRVDLRFRFPAGTAVLVIGRAGAEELAMPRLTSELCKAVSKLTSRLKAET